MAPAHAPFIMPDGRTLSQVLKAESAAERKESLSVRKKARSRAKDELWGLLQQTKGTATEQEVAEVRAMERAGNRRRRQWLNEKLLRDLAGPMTHGEMESQFKPVPFGFDQPPSAFTLAAAPQHAAIWDLFRSIDSDKQARVLQAWETHNNQQQQHHHHAAASHGLGPDATGPTAAADPRAAAAAAALAKWARTSPRARAALKRASPHAVLSLEVQALQLLEQEDPCAGLVLELPDAFARLLVHGLAQFHGLRSSTCVQGGSKVVVLQQTQQQQAQSSSISSLAGGGSDSSAVAAPTREQQTAESQQQQAGAAPAAADGPQQQEQAREEEQEHAGAGELLCSDVVTVLQQFGSCLDMCTLCRYVSSLEQEEGREAACVL